MNAHDNRAYMGYGVRVGGVGRVGRGGGGGVREVRLHVQ